MNLTPDQLGEKGESRFKELCADAQFICNRSDRDRAGWDFIVEGDFDASVDTSLDQRRAPLACHIQVKTVSATRPSVRLKLNMAERLAKELKPSFICVIVVNKQLDVDSIFLLHMTELRLAAVLKKLRKHSAASVPVDRLNKFSITFTPTPGERIDPTGSGLRQRLQQACGSDIAAYAVKKQQQLKRLGYKGNAYEVKMSMPALSSKEMGDIFLGITKQVDASSFELFETRFGIKIAKDKSESVKFTIAPNPIVCQLIVRSPGLLPVTINSEMLLASKEMTGGLARIRLQNPIFTADLYPESNEEISHFQFYPEGTSMALSLWKKSCQIIKLLATGNSSIEIVSKIGKSTAGIQTTSSETLNTSSLRRLAAVIDSIELIGRHAGIDLEDMKFDQKELTRAANKVLMVSSMIKRDADLTIRWPAAEALLKYAPCRPLVAGCIPFKSSQLAYSFLAEFAVAESSEAHEVELHSFELQSADWIELSASAYSNYENGAKAQANAEHVFNISASVELEFD